jgi:hypothetical protein
LLAHHPKSNSAVLRTLIWGVIVRCRFRRIVGESVHAIDYVSSHMGAQSIILSILVQASPSKEQAVERLPQKSRIVN